MENTDAFNEAVERLLKGDPRCPIPIGTRIEKMNSEPGDLVEDGHKGIVHGSGWVEKLNDALYLVRWDGVATPVSPNAPADVEAYVAIAGYRIKRIDSL
jgi:hypothetical protein